MNPPVRLGAVILGLAAAMSWMVTQRSVRAADTVTFSEHVAPIVFAHCTPCHRPGEAAPFSLRMPPWKAGPSDFEFRNARRLPDADIATLRQWVEDGTPEGDPRRLPPMPTFTSGWSLGKPDLVVSMPEPFTVRGDGRDIYRSG